MVWIRLKHSGLVLSIFLFRWLHGMLIEHWWAVLGPCYYVFIWYDCARSASRGTSVYSSQYAQILLAAECIRLDRCKFLLVFYYICAWLRWSLGPKTRWGAHIYPGGLGCTGLSWRAHGLGLSWGLTTATVVSPPQHGCRHCRNIGGTAVALSRVLTALQASWLCHSVTLQCTVTPNPPQCNFTLCPLPDAPPCIAEWPQLRGRTWNFLLGINLVSVTTYADRRQQLCGGDSEGCHCHPPPPTSPKQRWCDLLPPQLPPGLRTAPAPNLTSQPGAPALRSALSLPWLKKWKWNFCSLLNIPCII